MRIIYINEREVMINRFKRRVGGMGFDVVGLLPEPDLESFAQTVVGQGQYPSIVVTNPRLNEFRVDVGPVGYNGIDLVREVKEKMPWLPCFLLHSIDTSAIRCLLQVVGRLSYMPHDPTDTDSDLAFLQEMRDRVTLGREGDVTELDYVYRMISDWIDELRSYS